MTRSSAVTPAGIALASSLPVGWEEAQRAEVLAAALETCRPGVLIADARGRIVSHNAAARTILRASAEELGASDDVTVLGGLAERLESPHVLRQALLRAYAEPWCELRETVAFADGRAFEVELQPLVVRGDVHGRVWALYDRSADHEVRHELRRATRQLRESQAVAQLGIWEWDFEKDQATWSDELYRLYGLESGTAEPNLDGVLALTHADDRAVAESAYRLAVESPSPVEREWRIVRADGAVRMLHTRAERLVDGDGRVRVVGTQQDVTERHAARLAWLTAERRFREAFDEAPVGMVVLDPDGRPTQVNRAMSDITGHARETLLHMRPSMLLTSGERDECRAELAPLLAGERQRVRFQRRFRTAAGESRWASIGVSALCDAAGRPSEVLVTVSDVTDTRRTEQRLIHAAEHDGLTGLPNAAAFASRLADALEGGTEDDAVAVLYVDLDRFKSVNDAFGRVAADQLLKAVASRLRSAIAPGALVARVGGDEFAVLLDPAPSEPAAAALAEALRDAIGAPLRLGDATVTVRASVGVAVSPRRTRCSDELLAEAEAALYEAKDKGRDRTEIFDAEARRSKIDDGRIEADLRRAVEAGDLNVVFQPIVDLADGTVASFEALVRWRHPVLGDVSPGRFIPLAEQSTLIIPLGDWVLRTVAGYVARWRAAGLRVPPVAVNVSPRQLAQPGFAEHVCALLRETGVPPEALVLEVTETALLELPVSPVSALDELCDRGFRTVLDDFGTGYSSLSHLKRFPVEGLKIDRSFVSDLPGDPHAAAIVEAVIGMGRAVGLETVAEGVETEEQAEFVRGLGCAHAQGWLFSRPLAAERVPGVLSHGLPVAVGTAASDDPTATMTLGEAASALGVSANTVRRWADGGRLRAVRTSGGHRRFRRTDVEREASRRTGGPVLRAPRLPGRALPATAVAVREQRAWIHHVALRALYVGDDHGWFGTPVGASVLDRWLRCLADAMEEGDHHRVLEATRELLRSARGATVPLLERVGFVEAAAQAVRAALAKRPDAGDELSDFSRLAAALRRLAVDGAG